MRDEFAAGKAPSFGERAFETFYRETFAEAWSLARRIARDEGRADDICQEAYLTVWRYWVTGRLRDVPRLLLFRVIGRAAIDVLRKRRRREQVEAPFGSAEQAADFAATPLWRALARLRPGDASLLLLKTAVGLSYAELAQIEETTISAVRSRLYRARRELAAHYEAEGGAW